MEKIKASVSAGNMISLHCPKCGLIKQASVARFKGDKHTLKVRCSCGNLLTVELDFRQKYRKTTNLHGEYAVLSPGVQQKKAPDVKPLFYKCLIANISLTGLGLILSGHKLKIGDELRVRFILDDKKESEMDRNVVVRVIDKNYIGCEFNDDAYYQYDKTLGFYLMP
jgi:hypothetical protein